jgi:uncharacterized protein (DUF1697 family)
MPFKSKAQRPEGAMTTYIGLLRGINIGPHKRIAMAGLKTLLGELGFEDPRTLLASGNVVFRADAQSTAALERVLKTATAQHLGVETEYFVRTAKEWNAIIEANPFPADAKRDPSHFIVMCFKDAPSASAVKALQAAIVGRETVKTKGLQAYCKYPDGMGTSKLTIGLIEKMLGTRGTARNWNTVMKLGALAES